MKPSDLATNSFGQNYNCTMIQMAAAYCSVINGGSYYEPHVVKQILNEQGAVVKKIEPNLVRETVSENTANFIKDALFRTVSEGTGKAAAVEGYEIAGKTGTAEKYPRGHGNYLVSFCGFAPAYDPQVLVYVIIDTPHVADQPHSTYASGVFSKIMAEILPYMNIFPAYTGEEDSAAMEALPQQEGIADNSANAEAGEPVPEETKVYATEEYVDPEVEENSGIPNNVPVDENGGMIVEIDPGSSDDSSPGSDTPGSQVVVNAEDNWAAEASKAADREEESQNGEEEMQEIVIQ
jgi:stage V sporulation protein D (sporulation-specific penicillin-binding protein)